MCLISHANFERLLFTLSYLIQQLTCSWTVLLHMPDANFNIKTCQKSYHFKNKMVRKRKLILIEGLFGLTSIIVLVLYLQAMFSYIYDKYEIYQPPWLSKAVNITKYQDFVSYETEFPIPRILCWISTHSRNRKVILILTLVRLLLIITMGFVIYRNLRL